MVWLEVDDGGLCFGQGFKIGVPSPAVVVANGVTVVDVAGPLSVALWPGGGR
jgi:hypothetical protein